MSLDGQLSAGDRFVGLRIERVLARGAAGTLYLAIDEANDTPLVVKALPLTAAGRGGDATSREAFEQEARTAMALHHVGIVTVYGVACLPGLGCIVMELLPGTDLGRYNPPGHLLPEALALDIAARVAEALAYAHRQGVVHRDVKPANVMFDAASGSVKLTDFGIARASDAEATRSGMLLGSPAYMAPELLAGASADARSDLYALGVLLFELLTGRLPYEGASMGALLRAMADGTPQSVAGLRPDLDPEAAAAVDAALAQVWQRTPADRVGDGMGWAQTLRSLAQAHFSRIGRTGRTSVL
ncbi:MAG: serine/threonine-protein kinase [Rubrivivax sp.]